MPSETAPPQDQELDLHLHFIKNTDTFSGIEGLKQASEKQDNMAQLGVGQAITGALWSPRSPRSVKGAGANRSFQKIDDFSKSELIYIYKKTKELKA